MEDEITWNSQKGLNIFDDGGVCCPTLGWIFFSYIWLEHCLGESPPGSQRCILRGWSMGSTLAGNSALPRQRLI